MKKFQKHAVNSNDRYGAISQRDFLDMLKTRDICVTSQTLRNWESKGVISPAYRTGLEQYRGLHTIYNEFALAESFATYVMSNVNHRNGISLSFPEYSLSQIAAARRQFCSERRTVRGYPEPDKITYTSFQEQDNVQCADMEIQLLKHNRYHVSIDASGTLEDIVSEVSQSTAFIVWLFLLQKGCDLFLSDKRLS